MAKPVVLVTGGKGQLGSALQALSYSYPAFEFVFVDRDELNIQEADKVNAYFESVKPAYCVNAAAYTAVDKAESEKEAAFLVNADAVGILAAACRKNSTRFIHISTDYVFDGESPRPYKESDRTNPSSVYGLSKLKGEALTLLFNADAIIIRTAWVYSQYGGNFVKTMLRLMKDRPEINVVSDQVGAPTYAIDLALAILEIVKGSWLADETNYEEVNGSTDTAENGAATAIAWAPGIYHYSNTGRISWYEFAVAIAELSGSSCKVNPIPTSQYPTPAKRPAFSLLDTHKIQATYQLEIPAWKESLHRCLIQLEAIQ